MQCHFCYREAAFTPDKDGLKVGLCEKHLQEKLEVFGDKMRQNLLTQIKKVESFEG